MADESVQSGEVAQLAPVSPEERLPILDVLRGFALLGIAVMNMSFFNMPAGFWALDERYFPAMHDRIAETVAQVIFAGKANSIFSFLFALGLTIQMQRAEAAGRSVTPTYLRRIAILLAVGLFHAYFIWNGDVLHMYAVLGLVLLALRNVPDGVLYGVIVFSIIGPPLRGVVGYLLDEAPPHPREFWLDIMREHMRIFREGTYLEQIQARAFLMADWYGMITRGLGAIWDYLVFLVTMCLGLIFGRKRWLEDIPANAARIRKMMWVGLGLGIAASAACFILIATAPFPLPQKPTLRFIVVEILFNFNRPLLCLGYIGAIALLLQRESFKKVLLVFAIPGRMPLTNYLTQSLIATTLFYSWGFGLFGKVGPLVGLGISVTIFVVQVFWSRWWLMRFQYGPLEWLWRAATYGKRFPMRRRSAQGTSPQMSAPL